MSAMFRHKCPADVNPKYSNTVDYREHIRRQYAVPDDAQWETIMSAVADGPTIRLVETGRKMCRVVCPDCGAEVTVTTEV